MQIELDIFSGRPNPRWRLAGPDAEGLAADHRTLQVGASDVVPPALGYRGFLYELDGATWRAFHGLIEGPDRRLLDPDRTIERRLAASLPREFDDLRERLDESIQG